MKRLLLSALLLQMTNNIQASEVLRVYNWYAYIEPQVIQEFEHLNDARVEYQTYTTPQELEESLSKGERWDVIVPLHYQLKELQRRQQLQLLDFNELPNRQFVDPALTAMLAGFGTKTSNHAVPYMWGSVGLLINPQMVEQALGTDAPQSWSMLFDTTQNARLKSCGISLLDSPDEVFSLAFNYRGKALGQSSPTQISRQAKTLQSLLDNVRLIDDRRYFHELAAGRLCVGMAWGSHALSAIEQNSKLRYIIPQEGSLMYIDSLSIPVNAPNTVLAHRFIDFMPAIFKVVVA